MDGKGPKVLVSRGQAWPTIRIQVAIGAVTYPFASGEISGRFMSDGRVEFLTFVEMVCGVW